MFKGTIERTRKNVEGSGGVRCRLIALPVVCALLLHDTSTLTVVVSLSANAAPSDGQATGADDRDAATLARDRQLHLFYWAGFIHSGEWGSLDGRR